MSEVQEAGWRRREPRYDAAHDSAKISASSLLVSLLLAWRHRRPARTVEAAPAPSGRPTAAISPAHRYSPLDQITKDNFNKLEVAWRFKTDALGPRPEFNFQGTPLMVDGVVYSTAGTRRAVVALDAGTGEMLWMHSENEGKRGESAPRQLSGRGLAYWPGTGTAGRAHRLRDARLPDGRARREDRRSRPPASARTASSI